MNTIRDRINPVSLIALVLVVAALLLAACSPAAAVAPTNTAVPAPTNTLAPATNPAPSIAMVDLGNNTTLGSLLVDGKGMTLYVYTKDTADTNTCSGGCAKAWPPFLTSGTPIAGTGVDSSKLGTITLADKTMQVTYNHMPLYYFAKDAAMGDTLGQNVGSVWFVVAADGTMITTAPAGSSTSTAPAATTTQAVAATATPSAAVAIANLMTTNTSALGTFLVDDKGMTLYVFSKDTAGVSNCTGGCAANWPAFLTTGAPTAGMGVDASKLGTITHADGSMQVTYNNQPLYHYVGDKKAGDTTGQGVGSVWYVLAP